MPYKDREKQREASRRNYRKNKERYDENNRRRRQQSGYRGAEYAKRNEERRLERAARAKDRVVQPRRPRAVKKRTPEEEAEQQGYIDAQRRMREEALAAMKKGRS